MNATTPLIAVGTAVLLASSVHADRIVANHDEWTFSNAGFQSTSDPGVFALNVVDFLNDDGVVDGADLGLLLSKWTG